MDLQILVTIPTDGRPPTAVNVTGGAPQAPPVVTDWRAETGFPKMKQVDGNQYLLYEPINPDWKSSPTDRVFGGSGPSGPFLKDPSNGDATHARRSPAGYPLHYGISGDGSVFEGLPPRVMYDGQTHQDDAAVADYKTRTGVK